MSKPIKNNHPLDGRHTPHDARRDHHCSRRVWVDRSPRMIQALDYFWRADQAWTQKHLITPLDANDEEAKDSLASSWTTEAVSDVLRSLARRRQGSTDASLGEKRGVRWSFSLVVDVFTRFITNESLGRATARVTPNYCGYSTTKRVHLRPMCFQRFIRDDAQNLVTKEQRTTPSPEQLFRSAVVTFSPRKSGRRNALWQQRA